MKSNKETRSQSRVSLFGALILLLAIGCGGGKGTSSSTAKAIPKNAPVPLNYETVSALITDMDRFGAAVKALDSKTIKEVDDRYQGVQFELQEKALFLNTYPDAPHNQVVFLVTPKDPQTGSDYVLTFDKKLPVIDSITVQVQLRGGGSDTAVTCRMNVPDPAIYMKEKESHDFRVRYLLSKRFYRSGTYDFDALRFLPYRNNGNAFIVFDPVKVELTDATANLPATCK